MCESIHLVPGMPARQMISRLRSRPTVVPTSATRPLQSIEEIIGAFYLSTVALVPYPKEYVLNMILPETVRSGGL